MMCQWSGGLIASLMFESMMCQRSGFESMSGNVVALLMFRAGCGEMWHGITRVHILLVKHINT